MHFSGVDDALWILTSLGQIVLLAVLLYRRLPRQFPIFCGYICYSILSDPLFYFLFRHVSKERGFDLFCEYLFQVGILLEVASNVLRPVKRSLPRGALLVFTGLLVGGTLLTFLLAARVRPEDLGLIAQYFVRVNFTFAILRLVIFSAIILFSQMLGIGWKNYVLHLATGLAFYATVTLIVEMLHHFLGVTNKFQYHALEQVRIAGWIFATGYWSYAMMRQEAPRKEFSPQMANFLVSISGIARKDRAALVRLNNK
jgi:hypothetical protein